MLYLIKKIFLSLQSPVSAKNLSTLIKMITSGKISGKIAKNVFEKMQDNDKDPQQIVEKERFNTAKRSKRVRKDYLSSVIKK